MRSLSRLTLLVLLGVGAAQAAEQPSRSRLCPEDLPEGVRLPPQPGCTPGARHPVPRRDGFYDLGNGTTVQVGGRASAEYGVRR
ncbi:hypothetical protein MKK69_24725 [Methylobacterium sp. J-026]|uniref:hypothetical protein n=1 Tax=Methylobacterium sp. J-026 TaxID=2836624 RepID=UPI001FBA18DD|nr:hypothetical protein [Methylobacterium sp. J-026]MCJ2137209.1 hypothetical protein [Methylobacterium sp. J-026]